MSAAAKWATLAESSSERAQSPFEPGTATEQNVSRPPPGTVTAAVALTIRGMDEPVRSQ